MFSIINLFIHSIVSLVCQPLFWRIQIDLLFGEADFLKETSAVRQENKQNVHERVRMLSWEGSKVNGGSKRLK